jgi:hypothetical protein
MNDMGFRAQFFSTDLQLVLKLSTQIPGTLAPGTRIVSIANVPDCQTRDFEADGAG